MSRRSAARSSLLVALAVAGAGVVAGPAGAAPRGASVAQITIPRGVKLSWIRPAGGGVTATRVERRDLASSSKRWRTAATVKGRRVTVRGLRASGRYRFRLRFRTTGKAFGRPGPSTLVRGRGRVPAVVGGLRVAPEGAGVTLRWTPAKGATGYRVERVDVLTGAVERLAGTGRATTRTDVAPGRLSGHWIRYRVVALDGGATAKASDPVEVRVPGVPAYAAYYALGDSYAAGTGLGQPYADQQCARSDRMWGALIPRSLVPDPVRIACSGAKTGDVRLSSAGGAPQHPDLGGTQLDLVRKGLAGRPGPTLITLSIGGNDALFVPQFTRCVTGDCTQDRDTETALIRGPVRASLDATFAQIREVAPGADVLVAGYPKLFTENLLSLDPVVAATLTQAERQLANVWAGQVNEEIERSAVAHGLYPVTDEVAAVFEGHGAGGADPWINSVVVADPGTPAGSAPSLPATSSIHPTVEGNQAYADVMTAGLRAFASQVQVR